MNSARSGGSRSSSARCRPISLMLSVRVPAGIRSGRCSLTGVLGKALLAPRTMPLPLPSLPSSAGRAMAALMPLPPLRPRSSPLPGASKPVYVIELRPEDGLYPLPYMATQADGAAWEEECALPNAPEEKARQGFFPDGSRSFEEIDRLQIGESGVGNLISAKAEVDFYRVLPPSGYKKGLPAHRRTDRGAGDIPPEQRGIDFFPYKPPH